MFNKLVVRSYSQLLENTMTSLSIFDNGIKFDETEKKQRLHSKQRPSTKWNPRYPQEEFEKKMSRQLSVQLYLEHTSGSYIPHDYFEVTALEQGFSC